MLRPEGPTSLLDMITVGELHVTLSALPFFGTVWEFAQSATAHGASVAQLSWTVWTLLWQRGSQGASGAVERQRGTPTLLVLHHR